MPARRSLDRYRAKRDFTHTPEPQGGRPPAQSPRAYCIQKHLATALHYDLRLEHRGVLLSWAVPKGPSLDPAQKRLAMQVEDHPYDYRTFEGTIPSGYGAGVVLLWDEGVWQPLDPDVDAALAKGELKFLILGKKLKGEWVLVRTGGRGGDGRGWLWIKHRDAYVQTASITEALPGSVHDGADFAAILARTPRDQWPPARSGTGEAPSLLRAAMAAAARPPAPAAAGRGAPRAGRTASRPRRSARRVSSR